MDVLVVLGTTAAYLYSVLAIFLNIFDPMNHGELNLQAEPHIRQNDRC